MKTHFFKENTFIANEANNSGIEEQDIGSASDGRKNAALRTGLTLNQRTLTTLASNGIAGFLTLGILLALIDSSAVDSNVIQASGIFLSAAFAAGLVGDNIITMLHEHRALDWWKAHRQGIPHSYLHGLLLGSGLTVLTQLGSDYDVSWMVIIGGALTTVTMAIIRWIDLCNFSISTTESYIHEDSHTHSHSSIRPLGAMDYGFKTALDAILQIKWLSGINMTKRFAEAILLLGFVGIGVTLGLAFLKRLAFQSTHLNLQTLSVFSIGMFQQHGQHSSHLDSSCWVTL